MPGLQAHWYACGHALWLLLDEAVAINLSGPIMTNPVRNLPTAERHVGVHARKELEDPVLGVSPDFVRTGCLIVRLATW